MKNNELAIEKQLAAWGIRFSLNFRAGANIFSEKPEYTLSITTPSGERVLHFKEGEENKVLQFASTYKNK